MTQLARDFGISRKTVYKWLGRYRRYGDAGVFDQTRRPNHCPNALSPEITAAVLALKEQFPAWGPRKLHVLLEASWGQGVCSRATVDRILARYGLKGARPPAPREEALLRFERSQPNELWQIDFTAPLVTPQGIRVWPVPVLDDHGRYCVSLLAAPACTAHYALQALRNAALRYGLPTQVLSDHGATFGTSRTHVSEFTAYLWACQVEHIQGRYAHPQTQGKLERFNRTLWQECIRQHSYDSVADWNQCFEEYRQCYNNLRPHQALCDATPASRYQASARNFVEPDRNQTEPGEQLAHRRVGRGGEIWLLQHQVKVGKGLAGWMVSARHEGGGCWTILFRGHSICQVNLAKAARYKPRP